MSSRDPQLVGISTKLYDQYGSIGQCSRVAHKQHEGKPGSEMEDWTKRNGYGQVPAYLKSAARQRQVELLVEQQKRTRVSPPRRDLYASTHKASEAREHYASYMQSLEEMEVPWRQPGKQSDFLPPVLPRAAEGGGRGGGGGGGRETDASERAEDMDVPSPRSRLEAAATQVLLRRVQSDPEFLIAQRKRRTEARVPRWQHPSPHPWA